MRRLWLVVLLSCRVPLPEGEPGDRCRDGEIIDCKDRCRPEARLGNEFCDDGTEHPWGDADFQCEQFDFDGGDCDTDPPACPGEGLVQDCAGECYPSLRVGNDFCDDGTEYDWGSADFDCLSFEFDGGDCVEDTDACPEGLVLDCQGNCSPERRLGNDFCDDGTEHRWGTYDFNCDAFDFDQGDCVDDEDTALCADGLIVDCDGLCQPARRIGNGFCDDGTVHPWGNSNFACIEHDWDGGDCPDFSAGDTGLPIADDTAQ